MLCLLIVYVLSLVILVVVNGFHLPTSKASFLKKKLRLYMKEKVVVTGLGIISPSGNNVPMFFDNICNGVSSISKVDRFDPTPFKCQIAGQVKDFKPTDHYSIKKKVNQNDLSCHYAVAAARQALEDAKMSISDASSSVDGDRVGVIMGTAFGGMDSFEKAVINLHNNGPESINPFTIPMVLGNTPAGIIGMEFGAKGPNFGIQTACATATHAIGEVSIFLMLFSLIHFLYSAIGSSIDEKW
jgi:3-oxoacyl-[acyl-carrier-protein] synthase II